MRRILLFLSFLFFLYASWNVYEKLNEQKNQQPVTDTIKEGLQDVAEKTDLPDLMKKINSEINTLIGLIENTSEKYPKELNTQPNQIIKPKLLTPSEQIFSIYNIGIGDSKEKVEQQLGLPKRKSANEYGTDWYAYHDNYQNFLMVSYDASGKVVGLYTNQDLISSSKNIQKGSTKQSVHSQLGEPLTKIQKGRMYYELPEERDYDVYHLTNSYVTIFYDKHQGNTVTALQIISEHLEENKNTFYTKGSEQLKEGFEYQLFDLTNATRVVHGINVLTWDEHVRETARAHSLDMAENHYFDHTNLQGQSPFDRMLEDDIVFTVAGENLAYGQFSSIFAHEGLMNSLGHRENILKPDYKNLGVGVAFNSESQPYYTENFYTE